MHFVFRGYRSWIDIPIHVSGRRRVVVIVLLYYSPRMNVHRICMTYLLRSSPEARLIGFMRSPYLKTMRCCRRRRWLLVRDDTDGGGFSDLRYFSKANTTRYLLIIYKCALSWHTRTYSVRKKNFCQVDYFVTRT